MKQTLQAINIPARRIQDIPQSPISVASSIPSPLRTPPDDVQSFAVIWEDHGHGAFDSTKSSMPHLSGFRANPHGPFPVDVEPPSPFFPESDEPFAILGSVGRRNPCFISLESEKEYDKFIHTGLTPERVRTKKLNTYNSRSNRSDSQNVPQNKVNMKIKPHTRPSPLLPPLPRNVFRPETPTPHSALTFAAVWDPENEGMSTFRGGRFFENSYQPPPVPPGKEDELLEHAHIRSRYMLPKDSDARTKTVASSTLNGLDIYLPRPKPTPLEVQPKKARRPTIEVDDEGFFETFSDPGHGHSDCEPHLTSRFSVTTTSTSNYIDVDFPESVHEEPVPPVPPLHKLERSESLASLKSAISPPFLLLPARRPSNGSTTSFSSTTSKSHSLTRSKSSPGSARGKTSPSSYKQPRPRLSNVFGKLRRNSQDEGWVSVEVKAVITDRVIKEA